MTAMPPAKRLSGLNPLAYMGVEPISPLQFVIVTRPPTVNDNDYDIGTIWLDTSGIEPFMLVNLNQQVATWLALGPIAGTLNTLTGNSGGTVFPDGAQNIFIIADPATGMTIVGNPGINTLTLTTVSGGAMLESLTGDVGARALPDGMSNINILGGPNINTDTPGLGSDVTVNLNNVIRWQNTDVGGTQGVIYLDAVSPGAGGERFLHNAGDITNTFLGLFSGNFSVSGTNNTGIGSAAGLGYTSGARNTALGASSLRTMSTGISNTACGAASLLSATTGSFNTAIGDSSLSNLITGSSNTAIGTSAGVNYTGAESGNILIRNNGVLGESDVIRIGSTQTTAFMAGVTGVTVANPATVVINSATGQLGVGGSGGNAGDNSFFAIQNLPVVTLNPGLGISSFTYLFGTMGSVLTELLDVDNLFFPGDGVNPATYTIPQDGNYQFQGSLGITAQNPTPGTFVKLCYVINSSLSTTYGTFDSRTVSTSGSFGMSVSVILPLSAGDVINFAMAGVFGEFIRPLASIGSGGVNDTITTFPTWFGGFRVS